MKERVFTLMWGSAWSRYGQKFAESFREYWPRKVELVIVTDRTLPIGWATQVRLTDVPGYVDFMVKHRKDSLANGMGHRRRKSSNSYGHSWKHDAVKWGPQGLCAVAGLEGLEDGDLLCWLDADVETTNTVPRHWISVLLEGHDLACLQRPGQHPEIGFWAARITPDTRAIIHRFAAFYISGEVFNLRQWHSAFVFGEALHSSPALKIHDLNSRHLTGHVWPYTALAAYTQHNKGKLKDQ